MMVFTRGSLLPSSWPLCLCVAFPRPPRVALREATRDNSSFYFLFSGQTTFATPQYDDIRAVLTSITLDTQAFLNYLSLQSKKQRFHGFLTYIVDSCCQPPHPLSSTERAMYGIIQQWLLEFYFEVAIYAFILFCMAQLNPFVRQRKIKTNGTFFGLDIS